MTLWDWIPLSILLIAISYSGWVWNVSEKDRQRQRAEKRQGWREKVQRWEAATASVEEATR